MTYSLRYREDTGVELRCSHCLEWWPLDDPACWDPKRSLSSCTACYRVRHSELAKLHGYRGDPKYKRDYNRIYRRLHPERMRAYARQYYEKHREQALAYAKARYEAMTPEQRKERQNRRNAARRAKAEARWDSYRRVEI